MNDGPPSGRTERREDRRPRRRRRRGDGRPETAALVPQASTLTAAAPADTPLSPLEVAEMKGHLGFMRTYKEALRLKLNAAEDLLVNGQREPSDRGVCKHLLGKLDHTVVEHAAAREPFRSDPAARSHLLAGALRVTADVGLLLAWLETLAQVRSRAEAAAAFAEVVRRIDFGTLAPSKLARLLQVLVDTFDEHERVQVLFSLLALPGFSEAFDAAVPHLPPAVREVCAPLRAVHRRLRDEPSDPASPALLTAGVELVLNAPDPVLRAYAEPLRTVLTELAFGPGVPEPLADRAVRVLLPTLARTGGPYADFALRRAAQLLRAHLDDRARSLLESLQRAQPDQRTAARWLAALDAPRLDRVALAGGDGASPGEAAGPGRLVRGFWLDGQRAVWVRIAPAAEAERLATEAAVQAGLALPGVAAVVQHGVAPAGAYVAVAARGRPLRDPATLPAGEALGLLAAVARLLRAVALAGAVLPDAAAVRFLDDPRAGAPVLADLDGVTAAPPADAAAAHARHVAGLVETVLATEVRARLAADPDPLVAGALAAGSDLCRLVASLDRAALLAGVLR